MDIKHSTMYNILDRKTGYLPLPVECPPCFLVGVSFLLALLEDATSDEDDIALALKRGLCPESLLDPDW